LRRRNGMQPLSSFAAAAALIAITAPALAQPVTDVATGLSVTPPKGYLAEVMQPGPRYVAQIGVKRPDGKDIGCRIGFQHAKQNEALTQAQINEFAAKPEWANLLRATLELAHEIRSIETYEQDGVRGAALVGAMKPEALGIQTFFVIMETPKGRTNVVCVEGKDNFAARRPEFESIVRAVTLPR
jgi:hypothetical protein